MSDPLFSIVIACYNNEEFVREAVDSALRQPHPSKEVVVVDDASKDGTANILESYGDSIVFERLRVNGGAAAARNHGVSVARGQYIVFLDGDDVMTPWSLKAYARIIAERRPALILGKSLLFHGDVPKVTTESRQNIEFVEYESFFDKDRPWVYNTSSLVVERMAFLEAGGWSPEIFYQDIQDLLNKLCVAGKTAMVIEPETVLYRMHTTNAVRKVAPFIEGIYKLLAKVKLGAYPGDRAIQRKRTAWFGGLILYWGTQGMRNGHFLDGLKLLLAHWWMVLLAAFRRSIARIGGRKPVEELTLEPNGPENPVSSHPAHPLAGGISS